MTAGAWGELLGNICASSELADFETIFYSFNPQRLAQQTNGLCIGIPSCPSRSALIYALSKSYKLKNGISEETHILKVTKNIYRQKPARRVWNKYLDEGLEEIGFKPSKMDPCLYFRGCIALLVYIDDCIMFGPDFAKLDKVIKEMRSSSKKFRVEDLVNVKDFLEIQVTTSNDKIINLNQPQLIDSIFKDVKFQNNTKEKDTPVLSSVIYKRILMANHSTTTSIIGEWLANSTFLEKSTRPDISYAVHQCDRFCEYPKQSHGKAVRHLCWYLKSIRDKGKVMNAGSMLTSQEDSIAK